MSTVSQIIEDIASAERSLIPDIDASNVDAHLWIPITCAILIVLAGTFLGTRHAGTTNTSNGLSRLSLKGILAVATGSLAMLGLITFGLTSMAESMALTKFKPIPKSVQQAATSQIMAGCEELMHRIRIGEVHWLDRDSESEVTQDCGRNAFLDAANSPGSHYRTETSR